MSERIGVYPGSFDPPTTAHLAVSEAAVVDRRLDRLVWAVSLDTLGKAPVTDPPLEVRLEVLRAVAQRVDWLEIRVTSASLVADIADGFDLVVMGADKWHQINEVQWYDGPDHRALTLGRLPEVAVAPRPPHAVPPHLRLAVDGQHHHTSSTAARDGAIDLMLPEARRLVEARGAWSSRR